ncbi:MAG: aromatic ring-hydroxylating dioxygenase subunit alpha [Actinobacteria bacterium]|nr:aromatic ring-hydroxylating dioxygenase subunit alpha [Actinomycetota bacterium]
MSSTSPVDPELLRPVLAPGLGGSRTLPAQAYLSPEVFVWEQEHLFEAGWVCLGRADALANTGDQRAVRVGQEGILLVRDQHGALRGFFNVCRHRGHELLEPGGERSLRAIKCPYHAWVYGLDGSLNGAPRFGDVAGFDRADHPLIPVPVTEWHGWIFVNASGTGPDFDDHVGNLGSLLSAWEPQRLFVGDAHEYVIAANWKTITENYHECDHCPSIHPALCAVTPPDSGENLPHDGDWVGGSMVLKDFAETMSLTGASSGVRLRGLSDSQAREVVYVGLFPNLLISLHPDYVMTHRIEPIGPDASKVECTWLFPPEAREHPGFTPDYASEFWDITNREDWLACESVQRGLASRGQRQGPFSAGEDEVHAFQAMVARAYLEGSVSAPPQIRREHPTGLVRTPADTPGSGR